jgi:transcriptional regulator with XRE-family HTH domain
MVQFDPYMLGRRIAAARELADITQAQLAEKAGLTQVTIARIERGAVKGFRVETLVAIADALNISLDSLLGRDERPKAA